MPEASDRPADRGGPGSGDRQRVGRGPWLLPSAAAAAVVVIVLIAAILGATGRVYADAQKVHSVASSAEGYQALRDDGVQGRVLVYLGDRSAILPQVWLADLVASLDDPGQEPPVMSHNITSSLVVAGVAREVYFVPPPDAWQREYERLSASAEAVPEGSGVRLHLHGAPVHLTSAGELPGFDEPVIVYIAAGVEDAYDPAFIEHLSDPSFADVVVREVAE